MRNTQEPDRPPDFRSCTATLRQNNWITKEPIRRDSQGTKSDKKQVSYSASLLFLLSLSVYLSVSYHLMDSDYTISTR